MLNPVISIAGTEDSVTTLFLVNFNLWASFVYGWLICAIDCLTCYVIDT